MAATLTIGWEKHRLLILRGEAGPGETRISHALELEWPEGKSPQSSPDAAGKLLRQKLDAAGIVAESAVVALPREEVVIRYLELPQVPDDELPDMVRLQAATKSAFSIDQLRIDFIPLPSLHNTDSRRVLLSTVPKTVSEMIRKTLEAARLQFQGLGLASVGLAELGTRLAAAPYGQGALILSLCAGRLELALVQNAHLLASHSVFLEPEKRTAATIQAEITRLLVATQQKLGDVTVGAVTAIADPAEFELIEGLRGRYRESLRVIDLMSASVVELPKIIPASETALWPGTIGYLLNRDAGRIEGVDFLAPRKVTPKKDTRPLKYGAIAVGVLAVIGLIYFFMSRHLSALDQEIVDLKERRSELEKAIKAGTETISTGGGLDQWLARDFQMVDVLDRVQQELPGTKVALLEEFRFDVNNSRLLAQFRAKGMATDREYVEEAQRKFAARGFEVPPQAFGTSRAESGYPVAFDLELGMAPPTTAKPAKPTR